MARKRHTAEEIVAKLRQVDVLMAQGRLVTDAVRAPGVHHCLLNAAHWSPMTFTATEGIVAPSH